MYYIVLYCILLNLNFTFELNKDPIFSFIVGGISWHSYSEGNKSLRRGKIAKKVHKRPASNKRKVVVILFLKKFLLLKENILHFVLATISQRLVAGFHSNYFLVAIWSERHELRL